MNTLFQNTNLIQRAFWLIKLRWLAICGLVCATLFAGKFEIALPAGKLYIIAAVLVVYNFVLFDFCRYMNRPGRQLSKSFVHWIIIFQVAADLFVLTLILHFTGGIENPFFLYYVFHMVLTSVMLTRWQSYILGTFAVLLFSGVVWLEYLGTIPHHTLRGFINHSFYEDKEYVLGTLFILASTLYLVIFMTTSVSAQLRKQQEEYEETNRQLQQKDHYKDEYVLRLTHDIKGHLAAIKSCLDVQLNVLDDPMTENQRDLGSRAYKRAGNCMAFVGSLLRLTRMKLTGNLVMQQFPFKNAVMDSFASIESAAEKKSIRLSYEIGATVDELYGEPVLLAEAVTNILFNAVRYTPEGGKIRLNVEDDGEGVLVMISDTGIGIAPGEEEKIFEEFYRAANARSTEKDGTGLGLSIAKQIVQRHGGKIRAENNKDGPGSTFSLYIPRMEDHPTDKDNPLSGKK